MSLGKKQLGNNTWHRRAGKRIGTVEKQTFNDFIILSTQQARANFFGKSRGSVGSLCVVVHVIEYNYAAAARWEFPYGH